MYNNIFVVNIIFNKNELFLYIIYYQHNICHLYFTGLYYNRVHNNMWGKLLHSVGNFIVFKCCKLPLRYWSKLIKLYENQCFITSTTSLGTFWVAGQFPYKLLFPAFITWFCSFVANESLILRRCSVQLVLVEFPVK